MCYRKPEAREHDLKDNEDLLKHKQPMSFQLLQDGFSAPVNQGMLKHLVLQQLESHNVLPKMDELA